MGYHITKKNPAVGGLSIHLANSNVHRQYTRHRTTESTLSQLDRYFLRPSGSYLGHDGVQHAFAHLTYCEYFSTFRLAKYDATKANLPRYYVERENRDGSPPQHVILRDARHRFITRIHPVPPSKGELFYLRAILRHRSILSFEDARSVNGEMYNTFQEAAVLLGIFANEDEAEYALREGIDYLRTPRQLRILFVHLLINDCIPTPLRLWQRFHLQLSRDYILQHNNTEQIGINCALDELCHYLDEHGKTISDYGLPHVLSYTREVEHELERWNSNQPALAARADDAVHHLNAEQLLIYQAVTSAILEGRQLLAFVDGKGGRGKTFLLRAICDRVRSTGRLFLPAATSAFAAQNYDGGRTIHSAFKVCVLHQSLCSSSLLTLLIEKLQIPVNDLNEMLISPIQPNHPRGQFIRELAAICWDEATMANRAVKGCVDETCRRVMGNDIPFGGKTVILLGDFRQTGPVIRGGSRREIVDACIKSSPLWSLFHIYTLIQPIRNAEDIPFSEWVDAIGDGTLVEVPLLHMLPVANTAEELIDFVFPPDILLHPEACLKRSILAPTNRQISHYNELVLDRLMGNEKTFYAADTLKEADECGLISPDSTLDYVARQTPPGLPDHELKIKTNAVYRLLRNFSVDQQLVKNVRVVVTDVGTRLITVRIIREHALSTQGMYEDVLIPRISFTHKLPSGHTLLRRQFPLAPAYATTFNSCQGLTLDRVAIDLTRPVFSHGQLYTALTRIRNRTHSLVRLRPGENSTTNVTYHELLL